MDFEEARKQNPATVLIEQAERDALFVDRSGEAVEIELVRHLAHSTLREAPAQFDEAEILMAVMHGARSLAETLGQLEMTAARLARERGVTVAQLARRAGISERAAMTRYRRRAAAPADGLLSLAMDARRTAGLNPDQVMFALTAAGDRVLCGLSELDQDDDVEREPPLALKVAGALQAAGLRLVDAHAHPGRYYGRTAVDTLAAGGLAEVVPLDEDTPYEERLGRFDAVSAPGFVLDAIDAALGEED